MGPSGISPSSVCSSQACLLEELPISNRERPLSWFLLKLLDNLAEGSPGAAPAGGVMPEPVAPGDVAAAVDPRGIFASADATVKEECTAAPTAVEGRNAAPTALEGDNETPKAEEAEEGSTAAEGRDAAPMAAEGHNEAEEGSNEARRTNTNHKKAPKPLAA